MAHTTDTFLQAVNGSLTHTTDALLYVVGSETHTTDALLFAEQSASHTTDALLYAAGSETHTTDAIIQAIDTLGHDTDTFLSGESVSFHTTDALLQAINNSLTHTTDVFLYLSLSESHTTDALLQAASTSRVHTTDTLLQAASTSRVHTTDTLLQAVNNLTHAVHSTDSYLIKIFTGFGDLVFGEFDLEGVGQFDGPGQGNLIFGEFEIQGSATFAQWFRPTNEGFVLPKFQLAGVGSFSFPNSYELPEQDIRWINRNHVLAPLWGWGRDGVPGCGRPLQPFRCVVVADSCPEMFGLAKKLDIIEEFMPTKWPDGGITPSTFDAEAEKAKEDRAKNLAEKRNLSRLNDPSYVAQVLIEEVAPAKEIPLEPKEALSLPLHKTKKTKTPGKIKILPKPKEGFPEAFPDSFPQAPKPTTPPVASVAVSVEYINSTQPAALVAVIEEPKEIPVVRTNFDIGNRLRRKRH